LVEVAILSPKERTWLNDYHAEVKEKVTPLLMEIGDGRALEWLAKQCEPL
jgi:Xaa-Pro aminopeptidase